MAGIRKHGAHRQMLAVPPMAAGSANDTQAEQFTYDAFAAGAATASATNTTDPAQEQVTEASLVVYANVIGQATNFMSPRLTHTNSAGTIQNRMRVNFDAAAKTLTANVPVNLGVASGGTVTGAGTATLTVDNGTALPWTLAPGDTITFDRLTSGTGLASPSMSTTFLIQAKGA